MTRFISLFSGAGGLDLGLEMAGWSSAFATDVDSAAVASLEANQGRRFGKTRFLEDARVMQADIRKITGQQILDEIGARAGDIQLLAGGPPCQSWSSAGHQLGLADPRGRLFEDYIRIAKKLQPRWLLFENVRGLVTARGPQGKPGEALELIRAALLRAGWHTHVDLYNAADFGVPQRRVRVIITGYRAGDNPVTPTPTHAEHGDLLKAQWVSLGEVLNSVREISEDEIIRPSGKLAAELRKVKPGSGVKSPGKKETTRPSGHWGYKQGAFIADLQKPARTVTASAQQDWIIDPDLGLRRLCPRECAAIQTFPPRWKFIGSKVELYRQIGNAAPPRLAERIGLALRETLGVRPERTRGNVVELQPLPPRLQAAIDYTKRDGNRNGESRRIAPVRRLRKAIV